MSLWRDALKARGLVADVRRPSSVEQLREVLASTPGALPVGRGAGGCWTPPAPVTLIETDALAARIEPDPHSCLVRCSANTTWAALARELATVGLSVADLVDTPAEGTVGGTLARRTLLPPLWVAGTAVGACIGFEALDTRGSAYRYRESPRTSSGPDLRGVWLGAEGRSGVILNVTLEARRAVRSQTFTVPSAEAAALRRVMERHPQRLRVRSSAEGALLAECFGEGRAAALARNELEAIGAHGGEASGWPERAAAAVLPWSEALRARSRARAYALRWLTAGPTHVVIAAVPTDESAKSMKSAIAWAARAGQGAHARWSAWGALIQPEGRTCD